MSVFFSVPLSIALVSTAALSGRYFVRGAAIVGSLLTLAIAASVTGLLVSQNPYFQETYWTRLSSGQQQLLPAVLTIELGVMVTLATFGSRLAKPWIVRLLLVASGGVNFVISATLTGMVLIGN